MDLVFDDGTDMPPPGHAAGGSGTQVAREHGRGLRRSYRRGSARVEMGPALSRMYDTKLQVVTFFKNNIILNINFVT